MLESIEGIGLLILIFAAIVAGAALFSFLFGKGLDALPEKIGTLLIYTMGACAFGYFAWSFLLTWLGSFEALPFVLGGSVGFALLGATVYFKHAVIGVVGGGLVASAFGHWIGPIPFPK